MKRWLLATALAAAPEALIPANVARADDAPAAAGTRQDSDPGGRPRAQIRVYESVTVLPDARQAPPLPGKKKRDGDAPRPPAPPPPGPDDGLLRPRHAVRPPEGGKDTDRRPGAPLPAPPAPPPPPGPDDAMRRVPRQEALDRAALRHEAEERERRELRDEARERRREHEGPRSNRPRE